VKDAEELSNQANGIVAGLIESRAAPRSSGGEAVIDQDKPLTNTHRGVLSVASHYERISQSRLASYPAYPATLDMLVERGYLERVHVPYSEPYFRITEAGRGALQEKK
jgi:DNA-binding MarR family transcriptional regulator